MSFIETFHAKQRSSPATYDRWSSRIYDTADRMISEGCDDPESRRGIVEALALAEIHGDSHRIVRYRQALDVDRRTRLRLPPVTRSSVRGSSRPASQALVAARALREEIGIRPTARVDELPDALAEAALSVEGVVPSTSLVAALHRIEGHLKRGAP
jgi:hypothetical protein